MKILLISGSPRKGNTEIILNRIKESLDDVKLILLREKNMERCRGCLSCGKTKECVINDDMKSIRNDMLSANIIVIGTPNYYDNVSGLLKDFMDRTNPFYEPGPLRGKKMIGVVVGGGSIENSKKVTEGALKYFGEAHQLDIVADYIFQGLNVGEVLNDEGFEVKIKSIVEKINSL